MSDEFTDFTIVDSTPELTLEPTNLDNQSSNSFLEPASTQKPVFSKEDMYSYKSLTPEEKHKVDNFSKSIKLDDSSQILQYGAGSQKKIADFSETALKNVKTKNLGEIGNLLTGMVVELQNFEDDKPEKGMFKGFFKKQKNKVDGLKAKYADAETNINKIVNELEQYQVTLMRDIAMLDKMYEVNNDYQKELTMYILAGKQKLEKAREEELPALLNRAKETGLPEDSQRANDYAQMIDRFDKKLYDLQLTRQIALQMAPQIRLVQNNDTLMSEKIQSSIVNTIPLWKSQMALALGIEHSAQAVKAQRAVTDMTNQLLKRNSEMLKQESVQIAQESERGIVDLDTLRETNQNLISTFDEVLQIQKEGREKRQNAEREIQQIEADLRQKLFELSQKQLSD